jgi:hypothetical protein
MADTNIESIPESDPKDIAYAILKGAISSIPLAGGIAAELLTFILQSPLEKRKEEWTIAVATGLVEMQQKIKSLTLENLLENEVFTSTLLQASEVARRNHREEIRTALRNAVLNSALPSAPDDSRQKMFVNLLDRMTEWHILLLKSCELGEFPTIDFSNPRWIITVTSGEVPIIDRLLDIAKKARSDASEDIWFYVTIVQDLFSWGLVANFFPRVGMMTKKEYKPKLTSLGIDFLKQINAPNEQ